MSQVLIRKALELKIKAVAAALPTPLSIAWENAPFDPDTSKPYLKVQLVPAETENPSFGGSHQRKHGTFNVIVRYPEGSGPAGAEATAEAIIAAFPRGLIIPSTGFSVQIDNTPSITAAQISQGWYMVPVPIRYRADIFN